MLAYFFIRLTAGTRRLNHWNHVKIYHLFFFDRYKLRKKFHAVDGGIGGTNPTAGGGGGGTHDGGGGIGGGRGTKLADGGGGGGGAHDGGGGGGGGRAIDMPCSGGGGGGGMVPVMPMLLICGGIGGASANN